MKRCQTALHSSPKRLAKGVIGRRTARPGLYGRIVPSLPLVTPALKPWLLSHFTLTEREPTSDRIRILLLRSSWSLSSRQVWKGGGGSSNAGTVLYASSRGFKRVVVSLARRGWDGMMRRLLMVLSIPSRNGPILVLVTERQTMCETTRLVLKLCVMWQDEKRWLARLVGHPRCERETGDVRRLCGG